jgi:predicted alpha/beta superfamily hydrolase
VANLTKELNMSRPVNTFLMLFTFLGLLGVIGLLAFSRPVSTTGIWLEASSIDSLALQETLAYRVSLPADYDSSGELRYPLLLILDGTRYGDVVAGNARFLEQVGELPEHLIVAIDSGNRLRDYTPTDSPSWEGDGGADRYLAFVRDELLPEVERNYRVRHPYGIWGHSAAGLFIMYTTYAEPGLFDARLVNDAPLDWDDKTVERELVHFFDDGTVPAQFLYFNSSNLLPTDDDELLYFDSLVEKLETSAPGQMRWVYDPLPEETHASIPLLGSLRALRALYDGYLVSEAVMFEGLDAVLEHYASIEGRIGSPQQVPELVLNEVGYMHLGDDVQQAVRAFAKATDLYPRSPNAWDSLSDGYLEAGRFDEALVATEQSLALAREGGFDDIEFLETKRAEIAAKAENQPR